MCQPKKNKLCILVTKPSCRLIIQVFAQVNRRGFITLTKPSCGAAELTPENAGNSQIIQIFLIHFNR